MCRTLNVQDEEPSAVIGRQGFDMAVQKLDFYDAQEEGLGSTWSVGDLVDWLLGEYELDDAGAADLTAAFGGASEPVSRIPENLSRHLKDLVASSGGDATDAAAEWLDAHVTYVLDRTPTQYGGRIELHLLGVHLRSAINIYLSLAPDGTCYAGCWDGKDEHECQLSESVATAVTAAYEAGACDDFQQLDVEDVEREDDAWYTPEGLQAYLDWAAGEDNPEVGSAGVEAATAFMKGWLDDAVETVVDWSDVSPRDGLELRTVDDGSEGLYISIRADGTCAAGGWDGEVEREFPLSAAASQAVVAAWQDGACSDADIWTPDPVDWDMPGAIARELKEGVAAQSTDPSAFMRPWLEGHAYDVLDRTDESDEVALEVQLFDERAQAKLGYLYYLSVHTDGSCFAGCRTMGDAGRASERPLSKQVGAAFIKTACELWPADPEEEWDPWAALKS